MLHLKEAGNLLPQSFNFKKTPVRVAKIENTLYFAAKDICDAIGLKNSRKATSKLDEDETRVSLLVTSSGKQMHTVVNLSGLFGLIFQSRKKEAKDFRKWVTGEVLPTLMKSGSYAVLPSEIKPVTIKEVAMYPYRQLLKAIGASPNGYAYQRAKNYPGHFTRLANGIIYVTQQMAMQIVAGRRIYQNRKHLKNIQIELPFNYNNQLQEGGMA